MTVCVACDEILDAQDPVYCHGCATEPGREKLAKLGERVLEILNGSGAKGSGWLQAQHFGIRELISAARSLGLLEEKKP